MPQNRCGSSHQSPIMIQAAASNAPITAGGTPAVARRHRLVEATVKPLPWDHRLRFPVRVSPTRPVSTEDFARPLRRPAPPESCARRTKITPKAELIHTL